MPTRKPEGKHGQSAPTVSAGRSLARLACRPELKHHKSGRQRPQPILSRGIVRNGHLNCWTREVPQRSSAFRRRPWPAVISPHLSPAQRQDSAHQHELQFAHLHQSSTASSHRSAGGSPLLANLQSPIFPQAQMSPSATQ